MPTLQGGLRIDAEDADDWNLLRAIVADAADEKEDLASRLGGMVKEQSLVEDWQEFVVPDLRESFQDHLAEVGAAVESASYQAEGGAGPIWISPDDADAWYSALNQARLAIEEIHRFGADEHFEVSAMPEIRQAAYIRSRFYCAIQGLLLEYVMK